MRRAGRSESAPAPNSQYWRRRDAPARSAIACAPCRRRRDPARRSRRIARLRRARPSRRPRPAREAERCLLDCRAGRVRDTRARDFRHRARELPEPPPPEPNPLTPFPKSGKGESVTAAPRATLVLDPPSSAEDGSGRDPEANGTGSPFPDFGKGVRGLGLSGDRRDADPAPECFTNLRATAGVSPAFDVAARLPSPLALAPPSAPEFSTRYAST